MSEWISVNERLPANFESCIVARKCGIANMYWDKYQDVWRPDGFGFESKEIFQDITHWMPLPEPPK